MGLVNWLIGDVNSGNTKSVIQKRIIDTTNRVIQNNFVSQTASCSATTTTSQVQRNIITGNNGGKVNASQNATVTVNAKCFTSQNAQLMNTSDLKNDIQTEMGQKDFTEGWGGSTGFTTNNSSSTLQENIQSFLNETISTNNVSQIVTQMGNTLTSQTMENFITNNNGTDVTVSQNAIVSAVYDFTANLIAKSDNTAKAFNKLVDSMEQEAVMRAAQWSWIDYLIVFAIIAIICVGIYYGYTYYASKKKQALGSVAGAAGFGGGGGAEAAYASSLRYARFVK